MRSLYLMIVLLLSGASLAISQGVTGGILGITKDPTGAVLPGVSITIKNVDIGITGELVTDDMGRYHATGLPLGEYEVSGSLAGFKTEVRRGIRLTVGARQSLISS